MPASRYTHAGAFTATIQGFTGAYDAGFHRVKFGQALNISVKTGLFCRRSLMAAVTRAIFPLWYVSACVIKNYDRLFSRGKPAGTDTLTNESAPSSAKVTE